MQPIAALLASVVVAVLLSGSGSTGHDAIPAVEVTPVASLLDQPVDIVVRGAGPTRLVTLQVRSTDAKGDIWASRATFRSDSAGTVDLDHGAALNGSYAGVDPMGMIDAMTPINSRQDDLEYFWDGSARQVFRVTATEGARTVATGRFTRAGTAAGVTTQKESIASTGFYGEYFRPAHATTRRPAVLEFGGSEGGLSGPVLGGALASHGYPTLDLAYFKEPGLPSALENIPLEYFAKALNWLTGQPQVDPRQIYVLGGSRGSEAALLLGAHYPNLVYGVVASSLSDIAFGSYPLPGAPAWTFQGRPVPYTEGWRNSSTPVDDPSAEIPVEDIKGPVFLDCGTADYLWTSCAYARTTQTRLAASHDPSPHVLYAYVGAGHFVNALLPYQPTSVVFQDTYGQEEGTTVLADDDADARLWPHLLSFLADPRSQTGTFTSSATPPPEPPGA